jgi:hypothetical protein
MKTAIAGSAILAVVLGWHARGAEVESSTAVVADGTNTVLTVANFARIQKFILDQGKRKTYCNAYSHNPFWAFPDFNAYLNPDPGNTNCIIGKSEFNRLVIQVDSSGSIKYWDVVLDRTKKELLVSQHHRKTEPKVLIKDATKFFEKALAEVDRHSKRERSGP